MNSNLRKSLIIFTAVLISANLAVTAQDSGNMRDILKASAIPVLSTDPDSGDQDLEFMKEFIGETPIVVLGESQHLGREQYLLKHRLTRFFVEKMGFRHIAIEDSIFGTIALDDYIKGADISPAMALEKTGGWYLWDTEEMLSFVKWLRSFNDQARRDQEVSYTGVDIEDPWPGIEFLNNYFAGTDKEFSRYLNSHQKTLEVFNQPIWFLIKNSYAGLSQDEIQKIENILEKTETRLNVRRQDYINAGGDKRFSDCAIVVQNLKKSHQYFVELQSIGDSEVGIREKTMFQNIVRIMESGGPKAKIIVWVHNAHAAKSPIALLGSSNRNTAEMELLGTMLKKKYGSAVKSIGMASMGEGEDGSEFQLHPEVLDNVLAGGDLKLCFLDISGLATKHGDNNPLQAQWKLTADQGGYLSLNPAKAFDGLFFIKHITGARHSAKSAKRMKTLF